MALSVELEGIFNDELTTPASVNGQPLPSGVIPRIGDSDRFGGSGQMVEHDGPLALAVAAEVTALNVRAGDDGDIMTIGDEEYIVLSIAISRNGIATIRLGGRP